MLPSCSCALPTVPGCVEMVNGVVICQHSSVDALLAALRAVMLSCSATATCAHAASNVAVGRRRSLMLCDYATIVSAFDDTLAGEMRGQMPELRVWW